ncbi:hypothetical protein A7A08_00793 [Methyloligella halotolerans]|uniref:Methyltransferase domain-containing protein n=1 Tax=Methyloligella halotolerans TaxID=1177755 RepID=A0A1E2S3P3_9HYPH|nr:class I SAM-dependent methyltransferase [Methyloligella halotolerans]ODA68959.1 hypothetical protein A7A08_00793 [Methyloligella halotolerans]
MLKDDSGKHTFARVAADYDAVRPGYPDALVADWQAFAGITAESRVAEFGCGPGKLTAKLAPLGAEIVASDLSPELLAIAKAHCTPYPNVRFVCSSFEDFEAAPESFDALIAATAFHWFDKATRWQKSAALLKPGGTLAIVHNIHRHDRESGALREALDALYGRVVPEALDALYQPAWQTSSDLAGEIDASEDFDLLADRSHWHEHVLGAEDYVRLLNTFSFQHNLPAQVKMALFEGVREIVEAHGGSIGSTYEARLLIARRR